MTNKQRKILDYVIASTKEGGCPPLIQEVESAPHATVHALARRGVVWIYKDGKGRRRVAEAVGGMAVVGVLS